MKIKIKSLKRNQNELAVTIGATYDAVYDEFEDYHFIIGDNGSEIDLGELIISYNVKSRG